jgi:elongation factor Ts
MSTESIKELRNRTSAGMLDCKKALFQSEGDIEKAIEILRHRGLSAAEKKAKRIAREGIIEAYIHHTGKIGALVELNCESDFVAHTDEFKQLAHHIAMQVAATSPRFITAEEVPQGEEFDPQDCLINQPFIKEPERSVQQVITEVVAKVGENIKVSRFIRLEIGCY